MRLRPYQREAVNAVYRHLRERDDNPCVVIPAGGGKTPVMATLCIDAVTRWNGRVLVLAHVKELLEQTAGTLRLMAPDLDIGVYSAGLRRRDTEHSVIVAGIQSVYRRAAELGAFDLVLVDECFVAGTPVSTPAGDVPIEKLRVGQPVLTAIGVGIIEAISIRPANDLVQVETDDGTVLTCTAGHPFFTGSGWVQAGSLEIGSRVFREEDVRLLRGGVPAVDLPSTGRDGAELHAGITLEQAAVLFDLLLQENQESDAQYIGPGEDEAVAPEASAPAHQEGRQRQAASTPAAGPSARAGAGVGSGTCSRDGHSARERNTPSLQAGHRASRGTNCAGVGRCVSSEQADQGRRSAKSHIPGGPRVASVTPLKRSGDAVVFNLHVREHPTYYAGGLLVHNCHLIPPEGDGMYRRFLADARRLNPNVRMIGLTATPFRMTSGYICTPENFLNHVCYEVGVRELIRDGYLCRLRSKAGRRKADFESLHVRGGEFIASETEALMDDDELVRAACAELVEYTRGRKSVPIFASGVEHGRHIQSVLQDVHGVECGFIHAGTPADERADLIARFRRDGQAGLFGSRGPLKYLCNVNVLTTGFDAPNVDCVALLRPTMSPGLFYQMVGRGFRLCPGKENCLILDYGGNILRHGPVDAIRIREVGGKGNGEAPAKECPECHELVAAGYATCPECGHEFPPPERRKHEAKAGTESVLSGEVTVLDYEVESVTYAVHTKKNAPPDHPRTLRVDYQVGFRAWFSEWICVEHTGWPRHKAESWWRERCEEPCPQTAEEAVEIARTGGLAETTAIKVRHASGEKYPRIIGYTLAPKPREPGADEELEPVGAWYDDEEVPF